LPAERNWQRRSLHWRRDALPAKKGVCPVFCPAAGCSSRQKKESVPFFAPIFAREAELASRSDTGLRKQTGEGEAFTGGGMHFPPKSLHFSLFHYLDSDEQIQYN